MDMVICEVEIAGEFLRIAIDITTAGADTSCADIVDVITYSGAMATRFGELQRVEADVLNPAIGESTFASALKINRSGHERGGLTAAIGKFAIKILVRNRWWPKGGIPIGMAEGQPLEI